MNEKAVQQLKHYPTIFGQAAGTAGEGGIKDR